MKTTSLRRRFVVQSRRLICLLKRVKLMKWIMETIHFFLLDLDLMMIDLPLDTTTSDVMLIYFNFNFIVIN